MAPTMWIVLLLVAATIYTGSCQQCPVGSPFKGCVGFDRRCPIGYYCHDTQMNNLGQCCPRVCWDGAPITDSYGRVIDCGQGRKGLCPDYAECVPAGSYGARSVCCNIRVTIG